MNASEDCCVESRPYRARVEMGRPEERQPQGSRWERMVAWTRVVVVERGRHVNLVCNEQQSGQDLLMAWTKGVTERSHS